MSILKIFCGRHHDLVNVAVPRLMYDVLPPLNQKQTSWGGGHFLYRTVETSVGEGGHFLYRTVQGCAAGIGVLFMPEII